MFAAMIATPGLGCTATWPAARALHVAAAVGDRARIEAQPVCIVEKSRSAGNLGDSLLYRYRRFGDRLVVGYFAYWSTERPWGDNALTFLGVPALAMETVYTHFLFVLPGIRQAIYGPGDVEGARVEYAIGADGKLAAMSGAADDGQHRPVALSADDLVDEKGRVMLMTDVWSHQLGARGAAAFATTDGADTHCYAGATLEPLSHEVATALALGDAEHPLRAPPAWKLSPSGERVARPRTGRRPL